MKPPPDRSPLGVLEEQILVAVLRTRGEAYGMNVRREIEHVTGRELAIGAVYATLDRLETAGLVRSSMGDPTPERGGRAKRYFKVTPAGIRAVKDTQNAFVSLWRGVPELRGDRT